MTYLPQCIQIHINVLQTLLTLKKLSHLNTINSHIINSLTHSLTPWCRVHLEKLNVFQLVKKFPAFYGSRGFITALTNAHHLPLS